MATITDVAREAGLSVATVSRVINALVEQGLIEKKGRDLRIVQPEEMNRLIQHSEVKPAEQ